MHFAKIATHKRQTLLALHFIRLNALMIAESKLNDDQYSLLAEPSGSQQLSAIETAASLARLNVTELSGVLYRNENFSIAQLIVGYSDDGKACGSVSIVRCKQYRILGAFHFFSLVSKRSDILF